MDLMLLLAVPLLQMPSILSLAYPEENPSLNRTAGALVPVFLLVGFGLDSLLNSLASRREADGGIPPHAEEAAIPARPRRSLLPAIVLLVLIIVTYLAFAITDLDITSARWFFHPGEKNPWPVASQPVWHLFYNSTPWVTGSLAIAGTAALIAGLIRKDAPSPGDDAQAFFRSRGRGKKALCR